MSFCYDWVQLGHVTTARVMHIQNSKWPQANFSVFQVYLHKYGILSQILLEFYQTECFKIKNCGYMHLIWSQQGIKVSINLDFNT